MRLEMSSVSHTEIVFARVAMSEDIFCTHTCQSGLLSLGCRLTVPAYARCRLLELAHELLPCSDLFGINDLSCPSSWLQSWHP